MFLNIRPIGMFATDYVIWFNVEQMNSLQLPMVVFLLLALSLPRLSEGNKITLI